MSNFPLYHGLELAPNSSIVNLVVENLASDPMPVESGRVWFNTTEKRYKISSLDTNGAVVVDSFAFKSELEAAIASLTSAVNTVSSNLTSAVNTINDSIATTNGNVTALTTRVATVEGTYIKKDGSVAFTGNVDAGGNKLTNIANGTSASDAVNRSQLDAAIAALGSVFEYVGEIDHAVSADLDVLAKKQTGDTYRVIAGGTFTFNAGANTLAVNTGDLVVMGASGWEKIDSTNSQVAGSATFITVTGSTDAGYTVDIDTAFKGRMTTVETGLSTEITNRTSADTTLQANIDTEVAARQAGDTALDTRVTNVEGQVNGKIGELTDLTTTDKTTIVGAINSVKADVNAAASAQTTAVNDLKTAINGKNFVYVATTAALSHTISHNFNTQKLLYSVMVQDPTTLIWRNDIVPVQETDVNTLSINLTVARKVKVVVQTLEDLA